MSRIFTPRSFRHYQTLGAIDTPARDGQRVVYGLRHFVQALAVRKLLREKVPAENITALLAGRSTEETRRMFLGGVRFVADAEAGSSAVSSARARPPEAARPELWSRTRVAPGVELHLRDDLPRFTPAAMRQLMEALEKALRRHSR